MIPVALYGIDVEGCERFYQQFSELLDTTDDERYIELLFQIEGKLCIEHLQQIDQWSSATPLALPVEVVQEVLSVLNISNYPDVSLIEGLLSIDGIDLRRLSEWLHFTTLVYPIWSSETCAGLRKLGLNAPFEEDIAAYGLYVQLIEGIKEYAPMDALPESPLPRQRILEMALAEWSRRQ